MDVGKAIQIMESKGVIEVTHNGTPVWLENIRGNNAEVTDMVTKKKMEVPLNQLVENGEV